MSTYLAFYAEPDRIANDYAIATDDGIKITRNELRLIGYLDALYDQGFAHPTHFLASERQTKFGDPKLGTPQIVMLVRNALLDSNGFLTRDSKHRIRGIQSSIRRHYGFKSRTYTI